MNATMRFQLARQVAVVEELWKSLSEQGVQAGALGRVEGYFFVANPKFARRLQREFRANEWEWKVERHAEDEEALHMTVMTPSLPLNRDNLLELVGKMVAAAYKQGCDFDGLRVLDVVNKRTWWRLW
jgi:hypothetical protein